MDDTSYLTSYNPFSEEDELEQNSSLTLVTSLFNRMKYSFSVPLDSSKPQPLGDSNFLTLSSRVSSNGAPQSIPSTVAKSIDSSKLRPLPGLALSSAALAPPLISPVPALSEQPTYGIDLEHSASRTAFASPVGDHDGGLLSSIPGFPIPDDARSIHTSLSLRRSVSVSKIIRKLRGEGLSRDYWMDDENCKECYDCKGTFTAWRRKHHCRICGQIFCSRCASNVIKASRFGGDGMIRVCNLCLDKIRMDEDDDDDRRSLASFVTSPLPSQQLGHEAHLYNSFTQLQAPFSASQMFGRTDEPFNLFSIPETLRQSDFSADTYCNQVQMRTEGSGEATFYDMPIAPFRRGLWDDEKDASFASESFSRDQNSMTLNGGRRAPSISESALAEVASSGGIVNSIQFPTMKADSVDVSDTVWIQNATRDDDNLAAPFIRSRVQSRIGEFMSEPGWRTRTESFAYAQELNQISMSHLRIMLRQMLLAEHVHNSHDWEEILLKIGLRIARDLTFSSTHREGADMDIRKYVKIKKIPGGFPRNSEYVDGAVVSKNLAHKKMSRIQTNPRIMLVTFPLEFQRIEGQYMPFGQILRQEREYLGNLASRIAALRPHIVLVERSVSKLALDSLVAHKIAVARNVKSSAMALVSRMTQGDLLSSIDMLAAEPRLGHCTKFRIQTFDHPLIPGRRKTYMRFEGCNRDMGCTILLRGGTMEELERIKKVTRFLTFIVRNLKLETHLWKDTVITLPQLGEYAIPTSLLEEFNPVNVSLSTPNDPKRSNEEDKTPSKSNDNLPNNNVIPPTLSDLIQKSLDPYLSTFISVSSTLRIPPPYPISRMKKADNDVRILQSLNHDLTNGLNLITDKEVNVDSRSESLQSTEEAPGRVTDSSASSQSAVQTANHPYPVNKENFTEMEYIKSNVLKGEESVLQVSMLQTKEDEHAEQRRVWEWYLRKNADDFLVEKYQCITLLHFLVPVTELGRRRACFPPRLKRITFYGENDCTLGQFIEKTIHDVLVRLVDPKAICTGSGCNENIARHCEVLLHHQTSLSIFVEQWDGEFKQQFIGSMYPDLLTTWSACRVCGSATPFIPVSAEMQRYSFGKFLELHFYPADVSLIQGAGCTHNIYQHHVRYFSYKGFAVRFQSEPIVLYEVVYPSIRTRIKPETSLRLKNSDFGKLHKQLCQWYSALVDDLKLIDADVTGGEDEAEEKTTTEIAGLINRANSERVEMCFQLAQAYMSSSPSDTLALNLIRALRQEKIIAWQYDLENLPQRKESQMSKRNNGKNSTFNSVRAILTKRHDLADIREMLKGSTLIPETEGQQITSGSSTDHDESDASLAPRSDLPGSGLSLDSVGIALNIEQSQPIVSSLFGPEVDADLGSDSDSTIDAPRDEQRTFLKNGGYGDETYGQMLSRLPRRPGNHPTVAELVQRYQDNTSRLIYVDSFENIESALSHSPDSSKFERRFDTGKMEKRRSRVVNSHDQCSISDSEQGYAAKVASNYLTRKRPDSFASRIPGPVITSEVEELQEREFFPQNNANVDGIVKGEDGENISMRNSATIPQNVKRAITNSGNERKRNVGYSRNNAKLARHTSERRPHSKVSNIAWRFEQMGKGAGRVDRPYAVIRGRRARPIASSSAKVEVFHSVRDAIKDEPELLESSSEADDEDGDAAVPIDLNTRNEDVPTDSRDNPTDAEPTALSSPVSIPGRSGTPTEELQVADTETSENTADLPLSQSVSDSANTDTSSALSSHSSSNVDAEIMSDRHSTLMRALSGLWPPNAISLAYREDFEHEDVLTDPEHIFPDSSMVVRTNEPTSIIALALNSRQYREMLTRSRAEKRVMSDAQLAQRETSMLDDQLSMDTDTTWDIVELDTKVERSPTEELKNPSSKLPWAFSFESGDLIFTCTMLYPEHFDALRRTYGCGESIIRSLARCVKWKANGGKSGSAFLKTRDDRFIAKELSRAELETMESFAPAYFDYISSAVVANRPISLAKIFGCYKLVCRRITNSKDKVQKTKAMQMNLLIMENLFYDRSFSKIFDLKGSTRNRRVKSTGRQDEVLLDENLVEISHLLPFYLREHSKRILRGVLFNDSKFLADLNIMDYSLVVGVDNSRNELVLGIVDYIRTYTWDKKLESWVKESAFLGGAGKGEPTIVSPRQYRQRFISSMERYFPLVPDRWTKQRDTEEDEGEGLKDLWPDW